jgi:CRISPR-associated protein (TIGR02584 family)
MNTTPAPEQHRILLAVTGMSPQIVTETLYALAVAEEAPWLPHEIVLITTAHGAEQARLTLLSHKPGWFHRLCRDYNLPPIHFGADNIHAIESADGTLLDDIRTPADNDAAADFITEAVRRLTLDRNSSVHASIAGGRKTMGFFLGYAMSLYGRPQDRLSHVLVSAPYESLPDFYYPTPDETVLHIERQGKTQSLDASKATVTLANIPFVRLRDGQPKSLLEGRTRFSASVSAAQRALLPARLDFNLSQRSVHAGDTLVAMAPAELAFYAMLARAAKAGQPPLRHTDSHLPERYLNEYATLVGRHSAAMETTEQRLAEPDLKDWFHERRSKCEKALSTALDTPLAKVYRIQTYGHRPQTRYGLALAPEGIVFGKEK